MNYYNYFTEIEEHFWRRRGAQVYLSPVDWALIAAWRESGIPLEAVLAGIDRAFEKWASGRRRDAQRPRALVYCAPAVLAAAETWAAAAAGGRSRPADAADAGFTPARIAAHLDRAAARLAAAPLLAGTETAAELRAALERLRARLDAEPPPLEDIDRTLTVLDDMVFACLLQRTPVETQTRIRAGLERELAPCRRRLQAGQWTVIERQLLQRRLLEAAGLPRLSLFFMPK